jgi:proteasome-associated ATPase
MDRSSPFGGADSEDDDDQIIVSTPRESQLSDVDQATRRIEMLEEKLLEARGQLAQSRSNNEKLTITIQQTRDQIAALRDEVEKLTQPPAVYGTFIDFNEDGTVDIFASGRKMRVALHPGLDPGQIDRGNEVVLNESFTVIGVRESDGQGEVVTVKEVLDERRVLVYGRADEERVVDLADSLSDVKLRSGDALLLDLRSNLLVERQTRRSPPGSLRG